MLINVPFKNLPLRINSREILRFKDSKMPVSIKKRKKKRKKEKKRKRERECVKKKIKIIKIK